MSLLVGGYQRQLFGKIFKSSKYVFIVKYIFNTPENEVAKKNVMNY